MSEALAKHVLPIIARVWLVESADTFIIQSSIVSVNRTVVYE